MRAGTEPSARADSEGDVVARVICWPIVDSGVATGYSGVTVRANIVTVEMMESKQSQVSFFNVRLFVPF